MAEAPEEYMSAASRYSELTSLIEEKSAYVSSLEHTLRELRGKTRAIKVDLSMLLPDEESPRQHAEKIKELEAELDMAQKELVTYEKEMLGLHRRLFYGIGGKYVSVKR